MAENKVPVSRYAHQVVESYRSNVKEFGRERARQITVTSHAAAAADRGTISLNAAAQIALASVREYEKERVSGIGHAQAVERVGRSMSVRFDDRGQDRHKPPRDREHGRGLSR